MIFTDDKFIALPSALFPQTSDFRYFPLSRQCTRVSDCLFLNCAREEKKLHIAAAAKSVKNLDIESLCDQQEIANRKQKMFCCELQRQIRASLASSTGDHRRR